MNGGEDSSEDCPKYTASVPLRLCPQMVSTRLLVLAFVGDYIAQWRASPSLGEIANSVGVSRSTVRKAVQRLVKSGALVKVPGHRGLSLPITPIDARGIDAMGPGAAGGVNAPLAMVPVLDYPPRILHGDDYGKATAAGEQQGDRRQGGGAGDARRRGGASGKPARDAAA